MMSFVNTTKLLKGISTEYLRHFLSRNHYDKLLLQTYDKKFEEIPDLNTVELWNRLNNEISLISVKKNNPIALNRLKIIERWVKRFKCKSVLDCGFGSGVLEDLMINFIKKDNWYGIDTSSKSILSIKKRHNENNYKYGSILKIPHKSNAFECVIVQEVIEHISPSKTFKAYSEVYRVLKPDGLLILTTPINENLEHMLLKNLNPNAHVRIYSKELLNFEIENSGFKILEIKQLSAFKNLYQIKKLINKFLNRWEANNILVLAQK